MTVRVEHGDSRDVLKTLADGSVDSVVTDTPYALVSIVKRFGKDGAAPAQEGRDGLYRRASRGFMNKTWDTGETAHDPAFWREVLRVLKPGGHLIAFGGTRTSHRMVAAIEDAGFEIRDEIANLIASDRPAQRFLASLNQAQVEAFFRCVEESEFGGRLEWIFGSGFPKSHDVSKGIDKRKD
jgi:site-specific DNA-methyltransferase (adenine-specific)